MVVAGNEHLNGLAYAIAALVPIYTLGDGGEVRAITAEELRHGYFRAGAKELHFLDGRASVDSLAVTPDGVEKVVSSILAAKEAR
jgi:hypothetical protein